ncbi:hypothetical protein GPECTOR_27g711 [Gonium pectorale]|uniref:Uncharacterized protein n=1 Tax=Gonium pectorale TaxID=33097 RepID=A0A150GGP8_GONPE|nr:hypothetical protein GPECTOR_27g711 [Gonium pectorale]|eukprot:KXZ48540.1 hypothetical protein GPECTOR_27g711 [Gonium pectorale]
MDLKGIAHYAESARAWAEKHRPRTVAGWLAVASAAGALAALLAMALVVTLLVSWCALAVLLGAALVAGIAIGAWLCFTAWLSMAFAIGVGSAAAALLTGQLALRTAWAVSRHVIPRGLLTQLAAVTACGGAAGGANGSNNSDGLEPAAASDPKQTYTRAPGAAASTARGGTSAVAPAATAAAAAGPGEPHGAPYSRDHDGEERTEYGKYGVRQARVHIAVEACPPADAAEPGGGGAAAPYGVGADADAGGARRRRGGGGSGLPGAWGGVVSE